MFNKRLKTWNRIGLLNINIYLSLLKLFSVIMRKLKLIWDFRGPDASKIAEHHEIHLKEYIELEKLNITITGFEVLTNAHAIAYLVVDEDAMIPVRDALKPHRGQVYTE